MKHAIITILLIAATSSDIAGQKFVFGDPTAIVKVGRGMGDDVNSISLALQTRTCYQHDHCFNPAFVWLHIDSKLKPAPGFDYVYKVPTRDQNGYFINLGLYAFGDKLHENDDSYVRAHVAGGMELKQFVFSLDVYDSYDPVVIGNIGYRF